MAGNQSRGLIAASKTRGWDPTVIQGTGESIANFDKDQGNLPGRPVGTLPDGTPDSWPDERGIPSLEVGTAAFSHPDTDRENTARRTRNADPFAGMS